MSEALWTYFDPWGLGLTLALAAALLGLVLSITHHALGGRLPGMGHAASGVLLAACGLGLNMLQAWLPPTAGMATAVLMILGGLALLLGGVVHLRGGHPPWWTLAACCAAGVGVALWFGVVAPHPRWRIGLLSLIMGCLALRVAHTAWGETRTAYQAGMRLLALFGLVFAGLMLARAVLGALGKVESSVSLTPVNVAAVLAGGMALIGGVVGLVLVLSGDLMAIVDHQREHDPLSGLLNRLGLRQWIDRQPAGQALALGMVDLDHLKQINDHHGHALGDEVIRHVARLLHGAESAACRTARLGGEEFVVVALGADQAGALHQALERLREQFRQGGPLPGATLSAGLAQGHVGTFEGTLRQADDALYRAKQAGRNRVESAEFSGP